MKPAEILLRSAAECEHMAKFARDSHSKTAWRGMPERWLRNAELFERKESASRPQNRDRTGITTALTDTSKQRAEFERQSQTREQHPWHEPEWR
jgi:hypothetical protein